MDKLCENCEILKKLYKSLSFLYHAQLCVQNCSQIMNRMEARFMKNTKYFALGLSLLFSVCIQSQSVFAQEKAIEIQNEEMIVDQLLTMKGFSLVENNHPSLIEIEARTDSLSD